MRWPLFETIDATLDCDKPLILTGRQDQDIGELLQGIFNFHDALIYALQLGSGMCAAQTQRGFPRGHSAR